VAEIGDDVGIGPDHAIAEGHEVVAVGPGAAGDQAFSFIGSGLYTGVAGQLRYAVANGITTIAGDVNGDKVSDFHIILTGIVNLIAIDFVL